MQAKTLPNPQPFYEQVWAIARQVPYGLVVTYGQIAQMVSIPDGVDDETYKAFGSRWVGSAMAKCPADVPWQRVVNAQGKISQRPGANQQRTLLEQEGVLFVNDKIDLKLFQWRGDTDTPQPRQGRLF